MKKFSHYIRFFAPVILWAIVIFTFSSFPTGNTSTIHWKDFLIKKMAHIIEYALFTVFAYRAFYNTGAKKSTALKCGVLLAVLYGITDELHQNFTPGREPNVRDVVFDTIGASIAAFLLWKLLPKAPPRLREWAKSFQLS